MTDIEHQDAGIAHELEACLSKLHDSIVFMQNLAPTLTGRPNAARALAVSITNAQTSLLWLGFAQNEHREHIGRHKGN